MIGGSLAMALSRSQPSQSVSVWTRSESSLPVVKAALPTCRVSTDLTAVLENAQIVVLCTSPRAIEEFAGTAVGALHPQAVVTDAGSIKGRIVRALESAFGGRFVGAHPMAGSERSGISAARADLFDGATCIITPTAATQPAALEAVRKIWKAAGCIISEMSPEEHDRVVARISHLPHAVAAALVNAVSHHGRGALDYAASGFRDTTRIASGPADMWSEILSGNASEVAAALDEMIMELNALRAAVDSQDTTAIADLFNAARRARGNAGAGE